MSANKLIAEDKQAAVKPREKPVSDPRSESVRETVPEFEWFDACDARTLLNSMTRKVRSGPAAKSLKRW